jgi:hypothetical protein
MGHYKSRQHKKEINEDVTFGNKRIACQQIQMLQMEQNDHNGRHPPK